jgi:FHS family L-fucose permease-like MFS transporter
MAAATSEGAPRPASAGANVILAMVVATFFLFGGITNLNDILVPKLKGLFSLNYGQAMLVQFAFFTSYALFSIPAGNLVARIGYFRSLVVGFALMAGACLLFLPAANSGLFAAFLGALFMLGGGITLLQVAVNPLITSLGPPASMHSRLTFAQFFNSLGVFLMIRFGAQVILGAAAKTDPASLTGAALDEFRIAQSGVISHAYLGIAAVLALVAAVFWLQRRAMPSEGATRLDFMQSLRLLRERRLAFGVACIFLYVGAEVGIASLMVNYFEQKSVLGLDARSAGLLLSDYWLGALIGRFLGGFLLRLAAPGRLLAVFATAAAALVLTSFASGGAVAAYSLIAVGLANSIMFPTIFSLAVEPLGARAPQGSGLLCTAIIGGAIIPELIGRVADAANLRTALIVPALCYLLIAAYGWSAGRPAQPLPA